MIFLAANCGKCFFFITTSFLANIAALVNTACNVVKLSPKNYTEEDKVIEFSTI